VKILQLSFEAGAVSGEIWAKLVEIQLPSVSKSNWLHVDIFRVSSSSIQGIF
jgi:hypothetical protein